MIAIEGLYWPDDVGTKWRHSLRHVRSLEWAIARCKRRRTAVQAGGNIGLWPRRLAHSFDRVITFEPDDISRECLACNVPSNVEVRAEALTTMREAIEAAEAEAPADPELVFSHAFANPPPSFERDLDELRRVHA